MKTTAYFGQDNIQKIIASELQEARQSIYVAVAWLTDDFLINILKVKSENNVEVSIIFNDDKINKSNNLSRFTLQKIRLFPISHDLMHHKFCIIDNFVVISGSYNWTKKASRDNIENIKVTKGDLDLVNQYLKEFNQILQKYFNTSIEPSLPLSSLNNSSFYKFDNKQFYDVGALTRYLISCKHCWKDALIHYKNKYILSWIHTINDFDTIVQLDKFRNTFNNVTDEEELFFITVYSNPDLHFIIDDVWLQFFGESYEKESLIYIFKNFERIDKLLCIYIEYSKNRKVVDFVRLTYDYVRLIPTGTEDKVVYDLFQVYMYLKTKIYYTYKGEISEYSQLMNLYKIDDLIRLQVTHHIPNELLKRIYSDDFDIYINALSELKKVETIEQYEIGLRIKSLPEAEQHLIKIINTYDYILPPFLKEKILNKQLSSRDIILVDYPSKDKLLFFLQKGMFLRFLRIKDEFLRKMLYVNKGSNLFSFSTQHETSFKNSLKFKILDLNWEHIKLNSLSYIKYMHIIGDFKTSLSANDIKDLRFDIEQLQHDYDVLYNMIDTFWDKAFSFIQSIDVINDLEKPNVFQPSIGYNIQELQKKKYATSIAAYEEYIRSYINNVIQKESKIRELNEVKSKAISVKIQEEKNTIVEYINDVKEKVDQSNILYYCVDLNELKDKLFYHEFRQLINNIIYDSFTSELIDYRQNKIYLFRKDIDKKICLVSRKFHILYDLYNINSLEQYFSKQSVLIKEYNSVLDFCISKSTEDKKNVNALSKANVKMIKYSRDTELSFEYKRLSAFIKENSNMKILNGFVSDSDYDRVIAMLNENNIEKYGLTYWKGKI